MYDKLSELRVELYDAPIEVKEAYNTVVEYFGVGSAIKGALKNSALEIKLIPLQSRADRLKRQYERLKEKSDEADTKTAEARNKWKEVQNQITELKNRLKS